MAHRGVCPDMACQRVAIELERQASERQACQVVADELGIPVKTVLTWIYRNKVTSNEVKKGQISHIEKEPTVTSDLYTLNFDSGRKKLVYGVRETDGNRVFTIQEYRVTGEDKEVATKNRLTLPLDLFCQFLVHSVIIKEQLSGEPGVVGSDHKGDEAELQAGDDADDTQGNEHEGMGVETDPPPACADGAEDTTVEAPLVRCAECNHFAVKKWAPEENGACNSRSGSWNGNVFQPPNEPHHCQNFQGRQAA